MVWGKKGRRASENEELVERAAIERLNEPTILEVEIIKAAGASVTEENEETR
jgi:hypothetical protein